MFGKDDVTSERAVYALTLPLYYFLMAITTHDNKHDQRQRRRQIGMHARSPPRHVHRITYLGLPADGFHPEVTHVNCCSYSSLSPASSIIFMQLIGNRLQRIKFHIGKKRVLLRLDRGYGGLDILGRR